MLLHPSVDEIYPIGAVIQAQKAPSGSWEHIHGQVMTQAAYPQLFPKIHNPHPLRWTHSLVKKFASNNPNFRHWTKSASRWVFAGLSGALAYSDDLDTFTYTGFDSVSRYMVAWNGTVFCVLNYNSTYGRTGDGTSWTQQTLPLSKSWQCLVWDGTYFVGGANNHTKSIKSTDGVSWSEGTNVLPVGDGIWAMASDGSGLVVASTYGGSYLMHSTDHGDTWVVNNLPAPYADIRTITYENGKFLASSTYLGFLGISDDGIAWTWKKLPVFGASPFYKYPFGGLEMTMSNWRYIDGYYIGCSLGLQYCVWSTDLENFYQDIFNTDDDNYLVDIVRDASSGRVVGLPYNSYGYLYSMSKFSYNENTYFQFPMVPGDHYSENGMHYWVRVR